MKSIILSLLFLVLFSHTVRSNPDTEKLRARIAAQILSPAVDDQQVDQLIETFRPDGTWPGIDYVDTARIAFQHTRHLYNMVDVARAYAKADSRYYQDPRAREVAHEALNYWTRHNYLSENWWNNEVGTPDEMVRMLYLLDTTLTDSQIRDILPIAGRAHVDAWGARQSGDRIKIAGIQAKTLLFIRDEETFEKIMDVIAHEIKIVTGERGIQADMSFHHRHDRVNNTMSYGGSYIASFFEWADWVADTRYRFSEADVKTAVDFYLDGIAKQMVYGRVADVGIKNRDIARLPTGVLQPYESTQILEQILHSTDYRREEVRDLLSARRGEAFTPGSFAWFYWQTEHFVFQRPDWYTSVRMHSTRNDNMEIPYNGEGLTNHYRADGANYLSLTGHEYDGLPPVYDWRKIPGTTVMQDAPMPDEDDVQKPGLTDFVGAVTDGLYGAVVFDFVSPHDGVKAKKSWFFFDNAYVCLGTAISAAQPHPVATTLNQTRLSGDVVVETADGQSTLARGSREIKQAHWIFHNQVGYLFPQPADVHLSNDTQSGSWFTINRKTSTPREEVRDDVFSLWIDHGTRPQNAGYGYVVMPATDILSIKAASTHPEIEILSNSPQLQAVSNTAHKMAYLVFYAAGSVAVTDDLTIGSSSPGLVMLRYDEQGEIQSVSVSDPSRKLSRLELTVNKRLEVTDEGVTVTRDEGTRSTRLDIALPSGDFAGSSKTIEF